MNVLVKNELSHRRPIIEPCLKIYANYKYNIRFRPHRYGVCAFMNSVGTYNIMCIWYAVSFSYQRVIDNVIIFVKVQYWLWSTDQADCPSSTTTQNLSATCGPIKYDFRYCCHVFVDSYIICWKKQNGVNHLAYIYFNYLYENIDKSYKTNDNDKIPSVMKWQYLMQAIDNRSISAYKCISRFTIHLIIYMLSFTSIVSLSVHCIRSRRINRSIFVPWYRYCTFVRGQHFHLGELGRLYRLPWGPVVLAHHVCIFVDANTVKPRSGCVATDDVSDTLVDTCDVEKWKSLNVTAYVI